MNIDPTAGIGGAYVIDPKTGERVMADQAPINTATANWVLRDRKQQTADNDEPLDPLAA